MLLPQAGRCPMQAGLVYISTSRNSKAHKEIKEYEWQIMYRR